MMNRKLMAVPLGIAALAAGGTTAAPIIAVAGASTVVGNPSQQNVQSNTNSQIGQQTNGGGIVVGNQTQVGSNTSQNDQQSGQTVGAAGGGTLVGSSNQGNSQGTVVIQSGSQSDGSSTGTVVGNVSQGAKNLDTTTQNTAAGSGQNALFKTIVGSPTQSNAQYAGASQGISQLDPGVLVGNLSQGGLSANGRFVQGPATNGILAVQNQTQTIGSTAAGGATIVGNPAQSNSQVTNEPQYIGQVGASGTVVGMTTQNQENTASNTNTYTGLIV
jgi:hypothetical protein